jgi:hypothetical protein
MYWKSCYASQPVKKQKLELQLRGPITKEKKISKKKSMPIGFENELKGKKFHVCETNANNKHCYIPERRKLS